MQLPDLQVTLDDGSTLNLKDLKNQKVILYFYPKDDTPGCTTEACDFRDNFQKLSANNVLVLGVSKDSQKSHQKFKNKYALPFNLIVDEDQTLCKMFDVIKTKKMYGKEYLGIERSTFLFSDGELIQEWRNVSVTGHVADLLKMLDNI